MALQVRIREDAGPLKVEDDSQLDEVLLTATDEARKRGNLGAILIEAANRNVITMVVEVMKRSSVLSMATTALPAIQAGDRPMRTIRSSPVS